MKFSNHNKNREFNHDHFNTWQTCPRRYYFKYIKKLDWSDFSEDYELGKSFHALINYHLNGFETDFLLKTASNELKNCWELIKNHSILDKKLIKTEWGFNSRIANTSNWLLGRIDAIFYCQESNKYIIADWKTGKYIPKNIESDFQHKLYLYAFFNCKSDLGLDFKQEDLEFQYVKIEDKVSINTIKFSAEKEAEYSENFLSIIKNINENQEFLPSPTCPLKQCVYKNLCSS